MTLRQQAGRKAENLALEYLQRQGLELLQRNWRCKMGELDLIMLDGDVLVFVEVRYRQHQSWGGAAASVDARKQEHLIQAAQTYLQKHPARSRHPCRFDVVAFEASTQANWIRNAFDG